MLEDHVSLVKEHYALILKNNEKIWHYLLCLKHPGVLVSPREKIKSKETECKKADIDSWRT